MALDHETYRALGLDTLAPLSVNGRDRSDFVVSLNAPGDAVYNPCPEAYPAPDTPRGEVKSHKDWGGSALFADTLRDIRVYTPAGFDRDTPARLIVFNDGGFYLPRGGAVRAAQVLDSLHAAGQIAPTVAVFVDPGRPPGSTLGDAAASAQRSVEYDSITDLYGRFLIEELLPFVENAEGVTFSPDPTHRAVCGISSGGICAFTAAWWFPEQFGRVLSHCGSFVNIRGGHNLAYAVRATPRKPIRVFLQSGAADASYITGDWPLGNQTMASALAFAGYDHRFEFGVGGHSLRHGGAIFADSLRWLWRDDPTTET
jgi:enterochelin esterase family protein